jgi:dTDP-4-dehydrorhamnose reductase
VRVAVTGAGGGLGRAFLERVPAGHDVVAFAHADLPVEDRTAVLRRLGEARPDVILHLAAMTGVDACEEDPDAAYRTNALGTANVALAARETGALLVAISTDYVFDGTKGEPYHEYDEPNPLSAYGASKLAGEREARTLAPEHLVVRTSWVYGAGGDFASRAVGALAAGETVGAIVDAVSTPTSVTALAERLLPLAASGLRGVVHLGGPEPLAWFDFLARAKALGGLRGELVEQKAADLARPAPRPRDSSLRSVVLPGADVPPMPPVDDSIRDLLGRLRGDA